MGAVAAIGFGLLSAWWRWPTGHLRADQWHGLIVASVWGLAWTWTRPSERAWRWVAVWAMPVVLVWPDSFGLVWLWVGTWMLVTLAISRLTRQEARLALWVMAASQVPLIACEVFGWHPMPGVLTSGWWGSLGKPYLLSALCGVCSLWSTGGWAWGWLGLAMGTQSLTGVVPAAMRLWWESRWPIRVALLGGMAVWGAVRWPWVHMKVWSRVGVWTAISYWPPVGFRAFPTGFQAEGMVDRLLGWTDYHSAILEVWARFGPWALVLLVGLGVWGWRRCGGWLVIWALVLLGAQSVEALPMSVALLVLTIQGGRRDGMDTV